MTNLRTFHISGEPLTCPDNGGTFLSSVPENVAVALENGGFTDPCPRAEVFEQSGAMYFAIGAVSVVIGLVLITGCILGLIAIVHALRCTDPRWGTCSGHADCGYVNLCAERQTWPA